MDNFPRMGSSSYSRLRRWPGSRLIGFSQLCERSCQSVSDRATREASISVPPNRELQLLLAARFLWWLGSERWATARVSLRSGTCPEEIVSDVNSTEYSMLGILGAV